LTTKEEGKEVERKKERKKGNVEQLLASIEKELPPPLYHKTPSKFMIVYDFL